jgi:hypothetical protein
VGHSYLNTRLFLTSDIIYTTEQVGQTDQIDLPR